MKLTGTARPISTAMALLLLGGSLNFLLVITSVATQTKSSESHYAELVAQVKSGDQSVDFRQLREAYAELPKHPDTSKQKDAMQAALREKRFADAVKHADAVLAANFVDMDAHYVAFVAHRELKEYERADFHRTAFQNLFHSITDSGDGKTPETAFHVIDVHEEYVWLKVKGVGLPKSQSYIHKDGHAYDLLVFDDPETKKEQSVYFNVDIPAKHGV
jgi:hypothetical protein